MRASAFFVVTCALLLSCGGGASVPCPSSAGITGPGDGDAIQVCAVDARTGALLYAVTVRVTETAGGTASAFDVGPTGARLSLHGAATGATVTASATGYVTTSFAGFDASAMTIPLEPIGLTPETVAVDVSGLDALTAPGATSLEVYVDMTEPAPMTSLPSEARALAAGAAARSPSCSVAPGTATCAASVHATAGLRSMIATVLALDDRGTPDTTDDVRSPVGFAVARSLDVTGGHVAIAVRPATTASLDVVFGTPPSGLAEVVGVPGLASATEGVAFFGNAATPSTTTVLAPLDAPELGDAGFWVLAAAVGGRATSSGSITVARALHAAGPVPLPAWLPPPTRADGAAGATLYVADTVDTLTFAPSTAAITTTEGGRLVAIDAPGVSASSFSLAAVDTGATRVSFAPL